MYITDICVTSHHTHCTVDALASCYQGQRARGASDPLCTVSAHATTYGVSAVISRWLWCSHWSDLCSYLLFMLHTPVSWTSPLSSIIVPSCPAPKVHTFSGNLWSEGPSVDYMFFRNNTPNELKLSAQLSRSAAHFAYCCQCSWTHTAIDRVLTPGASGDPQWVCAGHWSLISTPSDF